FNILLREIFRLSQRAQSVTDNHGAPRFICSTLPYTLAPIARQPQFLRVAVGPLWHQVVAQQTPSPPDH
ncbi:MAG: hypothetical protein WBA09_09090, partial [Candidatus Acidiferrum sp.]